MDGTKVNKLEVLFEDNHVIVVLKPCNVLSQADNTRDIDMLTIVKEYLKKKYNKPGNVYLGLVHRLDRPISGIMVFAKTSKAASRLSEQVRTHQFKKEYLAVVNGIVQEKKTLKDYLMKEDGFAKIANQDNGKLAELSFEPIESKDQKTLLQVDLKTGRFHQIRIQLSNAGYPICGDQRYGREDRTQIALHAFRLSFYHPITKERLTFESLPERKGHWTNFTMSNIVNRK